MGSPYYFEMIFLGDAGVGKTTLFLRLVTGSFVEDEERLTIGMDSQDKTVTIDGQDIQVKLTDTGGGERFRTLTASFYRHAKAVILVYSIDSPYTLSHLQEWIEECRSVHPNPEQLVWALVGNKADLTNEVTENQVEGLCKEYDIHLFYLTSAKTGESVEKMFNAVVKATYQSELESRKIGGGGTKSNIQTTAGGSNSVNVRSLKPRDKKCC